MFKNLPAKRKWMRPYLTMLMICSIIISACIIFTLTIGGAGVFLPAALIVCTIIMMIGVILFVILFVGLAKEAAENADQYDKKQ